MGRLPGTILRVLVSIPIVGIAGWYVFRMLVPISPPEGRPYRSSIEPSERSVFVVDTTVPRFISGFNNTDFSNWTVHIPGLLSAVLDSLETAWSQRLFNPVDSFEYDDLEYLGEPQIAREGNSETGYVGYTVNFKGFRASEGDTTISGGIFVYNLTALATQQGDSTVVINFCETPAPIPWMQLADWLLPPPANPYGGYLELPYPGSKLVVDYGSPAATGRVCAWWLPCTPNAATGFVIRHLEMAGWRMEEITGESTFLMTRRGRLTESLMLSAFGSDADSGSLAMISYQGVGDPFVSIR